MMAYDTYDEAERWGQSLGIGLPVDGGSQYRYQGGQK